MFSRLRSPLLVLMIQSLLVPFCNEHMKFWVRKWIVSFFPALGEGLCPASPTMCDPFS